MNTYSTGLVSGIIFGVLFFAIMCIVRKLRGKNYMEQFDERQLLVRFRAYQISFFVLLAAIAADTCLKVYGIAFYEDPLGEFAAVIAAIGVFTVINIRNDAFLALNRNKKSLLLLYGVICLAQLLSTIRFIEDNMLIENGKLTTRCISPLVLILFLMVFVLMLLPKKDQGEPEEE